MKPIHRQLHLPGQYVYDCLGLGERERERWHLSLQECTDSEHDPDAKEREIGRRGTETLLEFPILIRLATWYGPWLSDRGLAAQWE
jgi:hypothetical protein